MPCFPDIPLALFFYLKEASHSRQGNLQNLFIYKNIPSGNNLIPSMSDYFIFSFFHPWIVSVRSEHVHSLEGNLNQFLREIIAHICSMWLCLRSRETELWFPGAQEQYTRDSAGEEKVTSKHKRKHK